MARTPLLQQLIDVCALAGRSDPSRTDGLSRRDFIGITAAGLGLAACDAAAPVALPPPRYSRSPSDATVAIVGAGLAGLTAAYRLRQQGVMATVYEANTRIGGRCWTRRGDFAEGQIAEHGGELIDQSHKQIRQLAQELGLVLDNVLRAERNGTEPFYYFDGAHYTYDDATRDVKQIWQQLHRDLAEASYPTLYNSFTPRGAQLDAMSIAEWIDVTVPGGRTSKLGQLLEIAYVIEYGEEATLQSALNLIYLLGFSGQGQFRVFGPSNEKYHVRGGNDLIVSRLTDQLTGQIVTDTPLIAVQRTAAGRYVLTFSGAAPVTVDKLILALPFSILRTSVDISSAGFDARKLLAIAQLGMGANAKLNIQFTRRHWETLGCTGDSFSDRGYQATWDVSRAQPGTAGILVDYTGGDVARSQSGGSANALAAQFLGRIEPVLPGITAQWNGLATFDDWLTNPWTLGSYSFWKVGQYTSFAGAEAEVSQDCHFAGEHTSTDFQGYLNGAVESGERAAREVLSDLFGRKAA
jgi:monoamine oxidase